MRWTPPSPTPIRRHCLSVRRLIRTCERRLEVRLLCRQRHHGLLLAELGAS